MAQYFETVFTKSLDRSSQRQNVPGQRSPSAKDALAPQSQLLECLSAKMSQYLLLTDPQSHKIFQDIVFYHQDLVKATKDQFQMELEGSRALISKFNIQQSEQEAKLK